MKHLSGKYALHHLVHNALATFGIDGWQRVGIAPNGDKFQLNLKGGHAVVVPHPLLWRSYRRGWDVRCARLSAEFGVNAPFAIGAGDTVIDVGANVGDFSKMVSELGARAFAFDGDPSVVECLKANVAGLAGVVPTEAVLWKEATELTFYSAPGRADSSIFLPPGEGAPAFTVAATTLDFWAAELDIQDVTLLKMDAEGAEPEVLEGAQELLQRTRHVAIDTGPERLGEKTDAACRAILEALGFQVFANENSKRNITFATQVNQDA